MSTVTAESVCAQEPAITSNTQVQDLVARARVAQAVFESNIKKIANGKAYDPKMNCGPPGMPRMMMVYQPMEIIIKPKVTYLLVESTSPIRRTPSRMSSSLTPEKFRRIDEPPRPSR